LKNTPWFDALIDPAGLILLASSIISGLLAAWWMFFVGVFFWLLIVINILRDPSLRLNQSIQNRSELSQRFQKPFNLLQKAQVSFFNSIQSSDGTVQKRMMPLNTSLEQLLNEVYENCRRYSVLENYRIVSPSIESLQGELSTISSKIQSIKTPDAITEFDATKKSFEEKIAKQQSTIDQLDKFSAELNSIQSEIDGIITDALQAQSTGEDELKKVIPSLLKKVQALKEKIA
jgi:predicted  nucleic acid-binding Zn-ribbon protein